jgi:copper(I)-binding protein
MNIRSALLAMLLGVLPVTIAAEEDDHAHLTEAFGLRIVHAWTNATDGPVAFVYAEIENGADADRTLLGAESAVASGAALTGFALDGSVMTEIVLPELRIAPASHLDLAPGEVAIRLDGLSAPLHEGDDLDITLVFDAGRIEIEVAVEAADATAHSHAGHMH